jgi:hypothetical protein
MKNLQEIKAELHELLGVKQYEKTPHELNKIRKRIQFLNLCVKYLESSPDEKFLNSEVKRLSHRLKRIDEEYKYFTPPMGLKEREARAFYNKEFGVTHINQQLKTLNFLLA